MAVVNRLVRFPYNDVIFVHILAYVEKNAHTVGFCSANREQIFVDLAASIYILFEACVIWKCLHRSWEI